MRNLLLQIGVGAGLLLVAGLWPPPASVPDRTPHLVAAQAVTAPAGPASGR